MADFLVHDDCICLECKVRAALGGSETVPIDVGECLAALGNVTAEILAHATTKQAKHFSQKLLEERKWWMKHPRVAVQQPPQGSA